MDIPPWLAHLTGAGAFANDPNNYFKPTIGDAFQGIGHDMMQHYRQGQQAPTMPGPQSAAAPTGIPTPLAAVPAPTLAPIAPPQVPQVTAPFDYSAIQKALQGLSIGGAAGMMSR